MSSSEIIIDVKDCKTAEEVFSKLSKIPDIFNKDKNNDNKLWLKDNNKKLTDSNKKIFWLKVDEKLYIKFDSCIRLNDDLLSSIQYRINDNNKKEDKPRLPVVSFNEDCICLQFNNLIQDKDKFVYTEDDSKNFHFHKNEEAKKRGKIYLEIKNAETKTAVFKTKENPALMQTLYRHKTTYLSNIGNTYTHEPLAFPLALCGVNVIQAQYDDPRCLCGVGCCSPYGMIDESDTKQLNDIFPQFDLEKANKQNEENIIQ